MNILRTFFLLLFCASLQAQTVSESFDNHSCPSSGFNNGTFKSDESELWWTYSNCKKTVEPYTINGNSLMLRRGVGLLESSQIKNGIVSLSIQMNNGWTSNKDSRSFNVEIYSEAIQQTVVYSFTRDGNLTGNETFTINNIDIDGLFNISIRNTTASTEIVIDELRWEVKEKANDWEPEIWVQFQTDPTACNLYDFSYAGYKNGEESLPIQPVIIQVSDYGAIADDGIDDTQSIQDALDAAKIQGGGTVLLQQGKYLLNSLGTKSDFITIPENVVLKGQGRQEAGTIMYLSDYIDSEHGQPVITTEEVTGFADSYAYTITKNAAKGSRILELNSTTGLSAGDVMRVRMYNPNVDAERQNTLSLLMVEPLQPEPEWTNFAKYAPFECAFTISKIIDVNTLELKEPLNENISTQWNPKAQKLNFSHSIGIEDLRIESAFEGGFAHHLNWEVDYGWCAIGFKNVKDGWIKNVVINNMTWDINLSESMNITVQNVVVEGHGGHHGIKCDNSWFCLIHNCYFKTYRHHVVGMSSDAHANVFSNITLDDRDGMIDFHGAGFMSNNLFEQINNVQANGGAAVQNMPHAGHYNVFWNLIGNVTQGSKKPGLDFYSGYWNYPSVRNANGGEFRHDCYKLHPKSIMVGVYHPHNFIEVEHSIEDRDDDWIYNEGFNANGINPSSLYKAQLEMRLGNVSTDIEDDLHSSGFEKDSSKERLFYMLDNHLVFLKSVMVQSIEIYDLTGKRMYTTKGSFNKGATLSVNLTSGLYLVKSLDNNNLLVEKILIR